MSELWALKIPCPGERCGASLHISAQNDTDTIITCQECGMQASVGYLKMPRLGPSASVSAPLTEAVDHPSHYGGKDDPFETIKVLRAWLPRLPLNPYQGGAMFNVIKYLSRAGVKGDLLEDLRKAQFYLNDLIKDIENAVSNSSGG